MTQKEWIDFFSSVNGRKPNAQEIQQAVEKGVIKTPKQGKKKFEALEVLALSLIVIYLLLGVVFGGYALWRRSAGNIQGTWELTNQYDYEASSKKWVDVLQDYKKHDYTYQDYLVVSKNKTVTDYYYYYDNELQQYPEIAYSIYFGSIYRVDQWNRKIKPTLSQDKFESKARQTLRSKLNKYYYYYSDTRLKTDFDKMKIDYASRKSYDVKGDRLVIKVTNPQGRLVRRLTYKKVSSKRAKELRTVFNNVRATFEDNYDVN